MRPKLPYVFAGCAAKASYRTDPKENISRTLLPVAFLRRIFLPIGKEALRATLTSEFFFTQFYLV